MSFLSMTLGTKQTFSSSINNLLFTKEPCCDQKGKQSLPVSTTSPTNIFAIPDTTIVIGTEIFWVPVMPTNSCFSAIKGGIKGQLVSNLSTKQIASIMKKHVKHSQGYRDKSHASQKYQLETRHGDRNYTYIITRINNVNNRNSTIPEVNCFKPLRLISNFAGWLKCLK